MTLRSVLDSAKSELRGVSDTGWYIGLRQVLSHDVWLFLKGYLDKKKVNWGKLQYRIY